MSKSLHHQIAARARTIIAEERRWVQGHLALNSKGRMADVGERDAYRFCAVGALQRAARELADDRDVADRVQAEIERFAGIPNRRFENLEAFNDSRRTTHAAVIRLFDDFIAAT